jgi:hypothetical protein
MPRGTCADGDDIGVIANAPPPGRRGRCARRGSRWRGVVGPLGEFARARLRGFVKPTAQELWLPCSRRMGDARARVADTFLSVIGQWGRGAQACVGTIASRGLELDWFRFRAPALWGSARKQTHDGVRHPSVSSKA